MRVPPPLLRVFWLVLFLGSAGRFTLTVYEKIEWQRHVTQFARPMLADDAAQASGREGGQRYLLLPDGSSAGYEWIAQAQQVAKDGTWRLAQVDYDNAPKGRPAQGPSLFRIWLAAWGGVWAGLTGVSWAQGIEGVALWINALTLGSLALFIFGWVAFARGLRAGAAVGALLFLLYPWVVPFASPQPSAHALALAVALAGTIVWLVRRPLAASPAPALLAGLFFGLGFWLDVALQSALLFTLAGGATLAALARRRTPALGPPPRDWRLMGIAQALVILLALLAESGAVIRPLFAWGSLSLSVAVLVALLGEVACRWFEALGKQTDKRSFVYWGGGLGLLGLVAGLLIVGQRGGKESGSLLGTSAWLEGWATPGTLWWQSLSSLTEPWALLITLAAALSLGSLLLFSRNGPEAGQSREGAIGAWSMTLALGVSAVGGGALFVVGIWILVVWVGAVVDGRHLPASRLGPIVAVMAVLWGAGWQAGGLDPVTGEREFTEGEARRLVERDLAYWLAARVGDEEAVVLAPAPLSQTLWFHGGLKVLGTPSAGNQEGFMAAVRLSSASSADEAKALYEGRSVTHVILPSWDEGLYAYARLGAAEPEKGFLSLLHGWLPPRWLRPVPYQMPQMTGWEGHSVAVFEVVDLQDQATALAHLGLYFLQTGKNRQAAAVSRTLAETFPEDLISLWVQGQVARAARDGRQAQERVDAIVAQLEMGNDEGLAWDDRVGLAIFLAEMKQADLARDRLTLLLNSPEDRSLRRLGSIDLFRLLRVAGALSVSWGDVAQQKRAEQWLPPEYRDQLRPSR